MTVQSLAPVAQNPPAPKQPPQAPVEAAAAVALYQPAPPAPVESAASIANAGLCFVA